MTVTNEVDSFDLSPSGQRAVISARGQILTIATERGDITRIAPDRMASRNQFAEVVAGRQVHRVSCPTSPAATRSGSRDPDGRNLKKITDLDNEKGAFVWTPDSKALLYTAADKKLYSYSVADGKTAVITSRHRPRSDRSRSRPTASGSRSPSRIARCASHVYIAPIAGGEERHVSDDSLLYSESNAVWTADGRYLVFTSAEGFSNGIATQGGITTTTELWALPLRDQDRDPLNRDIDNEAQGLAAEAAARQSTRPRRRGRRRRAGDVQIDWSNMARRARQLTVPGRRSAA